MDNILVCPDCKRPGLIKKGKKSGRQDYLCKFCDRRTVHPEISTTIQPHRSLPDGNVLVIGDTHIPFERADYLEFCLKVQSKYDCPCVIHIGDVFDCHSISYHESDPDGHGPGQEFQIAREHIRDWIHAFPVLDILIGNHDMLPTRKARTAGMPRILFKGYNDIWELPDTWHWHLDIEKDGVKYIHGTGKAGQYMHINWAYENMQPTVTGHGHSNAGVGFMASRKQRMFGLGVGCGIDIKSYAMAYGETFARRPIIGCGVVLEDGKIPLFVPMELE